MCNLVQALRLCTARTAHRGSRGIALLFLDHSTRRGEGSASRPGRSFPPGKTRYPLYRRLGGSQGLSGQVRKISPPPGFDPRTVQPVACRYIDWATWPMSIEVEVRKLHSDAFRVRLFTQPPVMFWQYHEARNCTRTWRSKKNTLVCRFGRDHLVDVGVGRIINFHVILQAYCASLRGIIFVAEAMVQWRGLIDAVLKLLTGLNKYCLLE